MSSYIEKMHLDNKTGYEDRFDVIHKELVDAQYEFEQEWNEKDFHNTKEKLSLVAGLCRGFIKAIEEKERENE